MNDHRFFQLSHPQKRIWYSEQMYAEPRMHAIIGLSTAFAAIETGLMAEAIYDFVRKHEGVRSKFVRQADEICQYFAAFEPFDIPLVDCRGYEDPEAAFDKWIADRREQALDPENNFLFEFFIFRKTDNSQGYYFKFHHLITDGWSLSMMTDQIWDAYFRRLKVHSEALSFRAGQPDAAEMAEPESRSSDLEEGGQPRAESYRHFLEEEQAYLQSARLAKNRAYWIDKFQSLPDAFLFRTSGRLDGNRVSYVLDEALSARVKALGQEFGGSVNTLAVAAYLIYLHKKHHLNDLVIGTPVLNRSGRKERSIFGMFTSTVPFRIQIDDSLTVGEWIRRVNQELTQTYYHQRYPYDLLAADLELSRKGIDGLFQTCVNYYNTRMVTEYDGTAIETRELYSGSQLYSLQLVIKDWLDSGSLIVEFDYKTDDYTHIEIEHMYESIVYLLEQLTDHPSVRIAELRTARPEQRERLLYEYNQTDADYPKAETVITLYERQAGLIPDRTAVTYEGASLSYGELNRRANALARVLQTYGVKKDGFVGILASHSIELVVAILAVQKAGGAYVPMDPTYPAERIQYIADNADAALLLTNLDEVPAWGERPRIDLRDGSLYEGESSNLSPQAGPEDLAYMIYTSGSTGQPKGTMIEHRGLINYIWWANKTYVRDAGDVFALYSSVAFDLTVTSIFTPLIGGSQIRIYDDQQDEYVLYRIIREKRATIVKLTPAHLSLLQEADVSDSPIHAFIVGGEDLKAALAEKIDTRFEGRVSIYNEYGPTETVVGCMIERYDPAKDREGSVAIGHPIDNTRIYLLDARQEPVADGTAGELYIAGDGVARGYWKREVQTAERFVPNPFGRSPRMYRTGDLAKRLPDGRIVYLGREDHQVKIRGYRIELGEIENALTACEGIGDVVVVDRRTEDGAAYLAAYYTAESEQAPTVRDLKARLLQRLPDYMVPAFLIRLDRLPLTPNGKIDRVRLPEQPAYERPELAAVRQGLSEWEAAVYETLGAVLRTDAISAHDDFHHLGGDSIKAIQISGRLRERGIRLTVRDIMAFRIVGDIAACAAPRRSGNAEEAQPSIGDVPPMPVTDWFFAQGWPSPHHYHQSVLLKMKQPVSRPVLSKSLQQLVLHHDALRLNVRSDDRVLFYNEKHKTAPFALPAVDLSGLTEDAKLRKLQEVGTVLKSSLDWERDLLFKACLFQDGEGQRLLLAAHHLVVDGVSWRILLDDLQTLLGWQEQGADFAGLPGKTASYAQWAREVDRYAAEEARGSLEFWRDMTADAAAETGLPAAGGDVGKVGQATTLDACGKSGHLPGADVDGIAGRLPGTDVSGSADGGEVLCDVRVVTGRLDEGYTAKLLTEANASYRTEASELLLAALEAALSEISDKLPKWIELEGHGRSERLEHVDVSRTVGWFTSLYPVKLETDTAGGWDSRLRKVKELLRRIPDKGFSYGALRYAGGQRELEIRCPIRFNYLGVFDGVFDNDWFEWADDVNTGPDVSPFNHADVGLEVIAMVRGGRLVVELRSASDRYPASKAEALLARFICELISIIDWCIGKDTLELTPSDFADAKLTEDDLGVLFS